MNEEDIFHEALARNLPEERAAFLEQACAGNPALRASVEALLRANVGASGFLGNPVSPPSATVDEPGAERPGTVIGRYKLLEQIGEGGMGSVWMAQQTEPVKRLVAVKLIKPGMDSKQVLARFEAERQALALMDHPNIAKILDGGAGPDGRPYFVMELVKGVPITKYCDLHHLTPRQRLELMVPVCQAIQHAHQKGIIHRDIKPNNVLVALYDDRPVPKVIDFGVAKATGQQLTEQTLHTGFAAVVGTVEYMSPEQASFNQLDVDTRSDIYSLGVLMYELLAGNPPFTRKELEQAGMLEMLRVIREQEPSKPSTKLSTADGLPTLAANRGTEPKRLTALVRGELDWIVMKTLEKDRSRRYETANGLAMDLQRYLADEAVEACPPSARYRLSKFARKYKKALATVAGFAVILLAGVVLSTLLAVWATSAEREANRQRIASDAAKQEAVEAKVEADKQRDEARLSAYAAGMGLAQRAWDDNDIVLARESLEKVPREAAGRDLRGFEWHYLSRLCNSEIPASKGHDVGCGVAFSPDGKRLASGSHDNTVKIWDIATGKELVSLKGHAKRVWSVAFSPDGKRLASGSYDMTVKIWDSVTGKELVSFKGYPINLAFSPDGQRLASGGMDNTVKIWDSVTGKELVSLKGHAGSVAFSPDGQRLASGGMDNTVKIWDSVTGKELVSLKGHAGSVAFSPDGQRLATGSHYTTLKIWDSATGKELVTLKGHTGIVTSVAFNSDGRRLASGSLDSTVKIWDSATGKERLSHKGHTAGVWSVAFSPDGQRLASASADRTVKIWDSALGKERFSLKGHADAVESLAFSPDGQRLASGSSDKTVKIWERATGKVLVSLKGHAYAVGSVAFSPDGRRLASGSNDTTVTIWDSVTGKELVSFKASADEVESVAFSPDGQRLASGGSHNPVKIWDSATGKELVTLKNIGAWCLAFSPDGQRLASGSSGKGVTIWDSVTGKELVSLKGHAGVARSVAFSPDGQRLASAQGKTATIWDSVTGKELVSLKGHAQEVTSVAFSPDGERLATGSHDKTVKIWHTGTGKELVTLKGHVVVRSVAFSPDGQCLACNGEDGTIDLRETNVSPETQERRAAAMRTR